MHPGQQRRHAEGKKELLGYVDGARESAHDWRALLLDQAPGSVDGAQARRRRWRARLLEGDRRAGEDR